MEVREYLSQDDCESMLAAMDGWLEESMSGRSVNFVEAIQHQIVEKQFLTKKQFEAVADIIPGIDWEPMVISRKVVGHMKGNGGAHGYHRKY